MSPRVLNVQRRSDANTHKHLSAQTNTDTLACARGNWCAQHVCKHICKHLHTHARTQYTPTGTRTCMHAQIHASTHVRSHATCIQAWMRAHVQACTREHTLTHSYTHALILNLQMRTYTYACLHMSARARTLCSKARDRGRLSHPRHCLWFRTCNLRCHPDVLRHLAPMSDPLAHMVWLYLPLSSCLPCLIVPPASSS